MDGATGYGYDRVPAVHTRRLVHRIKEKEPFTLLDVRKIGEYRERTLPVDSFRPNPWGLYQVHGNAYEWTEDCWNRSYRGAPSDGSAWTAGDCSRRVMRGGSWIQDPGLLRSSDRNQSRATSRGNFMGFRVARTLGP